MQYSQDDLENLDSYGVIRAQAASFVPWGRVDGLSIAWGVVADLLRSESSSVVVGRVLDWWLIASEKDWMEDVPTEERLKRFRQFVPYPEQGDNSCHPEVIISAFATDVVLLGNSETIRLSGDSAIPSQLRAIMNEHPNWRRILLYRCAIAPPSGKNSDA